MGVSEGVSHGVFSGPFAPRAKQEKDQYPKGPNLEKIQDRLKFSISLENFKKSLEIFNPDLQNSPQKIGVWWVARLKISSSLENFKILNFFKIWALSVGLLQNWLGVGSKAAQNQRRLQCFAYSWKLPAYSWASLPVIVLVCLHVELFY